MMMNSDVPADVLTGLQALDTPTVCNALELVCPERRGSGYTVQPLVCTRPHLGSMVGFARTATIRAMRPSGLTAAEQRQRHDAYYCYVESEPRPTVAVIQDLDGPNRGFGSFWGEVNSNIHRGLGCLGVVTDGSVRDLPDVAEGFQMLAGRVGPSHAFVHVVDFQIEVTVAGMTVNHHDLIHADQHGAVVVPTGSAAAVVEAAAEVAQREAPIIAAAKKPGFCVEKLREAWREVDELH